MQLRTQYWLLFFVLLGISNGIAAQVKFSAGISPAVIGKNEVAELRFTIDNAQSAVNISPPPLSNFIVVSGPNQESGMESINGNTRQYIGITFLLKPKAKGDFTIGAATAKVDGKILKSNPVKLKVVNEATGNSPGSNSPFGNLFSIDQPQQEPAGYNDYILKKGENMQDKIGRNLFIKVYADKTSCYTGEPLTVTYKLYTRLKSESNMVKNPAFNGFSVIDLVPPQAGINYTVEKLDGREYNVYVLRKVQLYPLQAGIAELETASVENTVHFIKAEYLQKAETDIFGNIVPGSLPQDAMIGEKVTIESKPVQITVKPLPEEGKPASFSGAVGNFRIDALLDKYNLTTDDAGKLKVLLSGEGNLTLVPSPEIAWPAGLEGYEPTVKDGLNKLSVPVSGSKIFEYPFTFEKPGSYTIPPVEFSFFDIASGKYKTASTRPVLVEVKKGTGKKPAIAVAGNKGRKESFFDSIFSNRWMIIVPVALLILTGLFVWLKNDRKKQSLPATAAEEEKQEEKITAETVLKNPLEETEKALLQNDTRQFYATLDKELHLFLAEKLKIASENISRRSIADALDKSGVSIADSFAIQKLLDEISLQLYTPFADENKMQDLYVEAVRVVTSLTAPV